MNWTFLYSLRKPKVIAILLSLILIAAIPLTVFVAEQQQQTQQKAAGDFSCRVTAIPVDGVPSVRGEVTVEGSKPPSYNAVRWFIDGNPVRITSEAKTTIGGLSKGPHTLGAKYIARSTNNPDGESLGAKTSLLAQADLTDTPVPTASPTETTTPTPTEEATPTPTAEESPTPTVSPTISQSYASGLRARYSDESNPQGKGRIDSNIDFDWDIDNVPSNINKEKFTVKWQGYIKVEQEMKRYFYIRADDKVRLFVRDMQNPAIERWDNQDYQTSVLQTGNIISLKEGYNRIVLEYSENKTPGMKHITKLRWSGDPQNTEFATLPKIPDSKLFHIDNTPDITPTPTGTQNRPVDCGTSSFTITDGASPTPTGSTTPRPTGSITPTPTGNYLPGLRGRYFDNLNAEGTPKKIRTDDNINFNWSQDDEINNPPGGISEDSFSVRWIGYIKVDKASERYFWVRADDKVKLTINQNVVLNAWATQDNPVTNRVSSRVNLKDGYNRIILDYSEEKTAGINAVTRLRWSPPDPTTNDPKYEDATPIQASRLFHLQSNASPTPTGSTTPGPTGSITPTPTNNGLKASYFNNQDLKNPAKVVRIDDNIHYDWDKLPNDDKLFTDLGVTKDKFSVRWEGIIKPKATANYFFHTKTDDGVRLKIANQTVIDDWAEHPKLKDNKTAASKKLVAGQEYKIVMEYFEVRTANETISHVARLRWSKGTTAGTFADATAIPNNILFPPKGTGTEKAKLSLKIKLDQIETSTDNSKPLRKERKIDLCIYRLKDEPKNDKNCANAYVHEKASVTFNPTSKLFENNNFEISKPITTGKYMVLAKTDGYLRGKAPAAQSIVEGEVSPIATITLYGGDLIEWDQTDNFDSKNVIDIKDVNALMTCGGWKIEAQLITDTNSVYNTKCKTMFDEKNNFRSSADINDDGQVDIDDQVILLGSLERRQGE